MAPALIGSVAWGFTWKLLLVENILTFRLADRPFVTTWTVLSVIQIWQFLPAFAFLFWLRLQAIEARYLDFGRIEGLTFGEVIRDIHWPHCRDFAGLLSLFSLAQGFVEYSKFVLIVRSSEGTKTELISHRIERFFSYLVPADPVGALKAILAIAGAVCLVGIVAALCVIGVVQRSGDQLTKSFLARWPSLPIGAGRAWPRLLTSLTTLAILAPLGTTAVEGFRVGTVDWLRIALSASMSLVGATLGFIVSWGFAFSSRLAWPDQLARLGSESRILLAVALGIYFFPPLALSLCSFYWLTYARIQLGSGGSVILGWLLGQTILVFPLLGVFLVHLHFAIPAKELESQLFYRARAREIALYSFISRFKLDYLVVLVFGFAFVFSESSLNSVTSGWSRWVPSMAIELLQRVDGRASSYKEAASLILISLGPVAVSLLFLRVGLRRRLEKMVED
jgi:hypothetical protein